MRRRRGFVQLAILHLLKEESMHGYQIMKQLEVRSNGAYSASAGTVYPALQELLERNLIDLDEETDKKVYSLNDNGVKHLAEVSKHMDGKFWVEWEEKMKWRNSKEAQQLKKAIEQWKEEVRKTAKQLRRNKEGIKELIRFIEDETVRLREKEF